MQYVISHIYDELYQTSWIKKKSNLIGRSQVAEEYGIVHEMSLPAVLKLDKVNMHIA